MHPSRAFPVSCLVASCALWGAVTVFNKELLSAIAAVPLLAIQLAASSFALALFVAVRRPVIPPPRVVIPLALLGVLNPGISYTLALLGLASITASTASLLWATEPLMIVALAVLILREPVTPRLAVVILGGIIGAVLVTAAWTGFTTSAAMTGTLLMIAAILCCALYTVLSRRLIETADSLVIAAIQQVAGLGWCAVLLMFGPFGSLAEFAALPMSTLGYAMLSGLLYYATAYGLFLTALRVTPAGIASGYYNLIPVFGVALAYPMLGERLSAAQWAGAAIILASATLLVRMTAEAAPRPQG